MTATAPQPDEPGEPPLPVAQLARALGVHRSTLGRALANADNPPDPTDHDSLGRPRYRLTTINNWWPNRRRPGRPPANTAEPPTAENL